METGKKYTVNVAYTTPSGRMHIGHGLGHIISDVALRYGALRQGKDTFFGFGMHSTGKDLIKILTKLNEEGNLPETLERYNINREKRDEILSLNNLSEQVDALVQEYKQQYQGVIERMGIAMNYDSFFSTHQKANQRYTQWTLKKLDEVGLIVETEADRPYCAQCDDIKHIDKDLSEVSVNGKVNWDEVRITDGQIYGGEFECKLHSKEKIVVKKRRERAINYADSQIQQKTIDLVQNMKVFPKKYKSGLEEIVKSRMAKPFERKAHENVGAISPFDSTKSIEALSDSNIYMEFYGISQLINQGKLDSENLTDSFFDYVYLDKGNPNEVAQNSGINREMLDEVKNHMENIYPVDISVAGFEHTEVHLPFSLFNHAAVLPKKYFFPEYIITSHVTKDGEKMSKSKGNVVYLDELLDLTEKEGKLEGLSNEASLDASRFFLSYYQSLDKDFDWNDNHFKSSGIRGMSRYVTGIIKAAKTLEYTEARSLNSIDKWISTIDQRTIQEITEKMDEKDSRRALVTLVDIRGKILSKYIASNPNPEVLSKFLINQINMGYPVMPRATKELREGYFPGAQLEWPSPKFELNFSEEYETFEHQIKGEEYEKNISKKVNSLLRKMLGRKEINYGETVSIVAPTEYQIQVLHNQKIPLSKQINLEFSIDLESKGIEVRRQK